MSVNTKCARANAEKVVRRDDTRLTEALLADAIGHLADELDALREMLDEQEGRRIAAAEGRRYD